MNKVIKTEWWTLEIPSEWQSEQEEESIHITDPDELGAISITTLCKKANEASTTNDIERIVDSMGHDPKLMALVELGSYEGLTTEYEEKSDFIREWFVIAANQLVVISYDCALSNRNMDRVLIDQILDGLTINSESA